MTSPSAAARALGRLGGLAGTEAQRAARQRVAATLHAAPAWTAAEDDALRAGRLDLPGRTRAACLRRRSRLGVTGPHAPRSGRPLDPPGWPEAQADGYQVDRYVDGRWRWSTPTCRCPEPQAGCQRRVDAIARAIGARDELARLAAARDRACP